MKVLVACEFSGIVRDAFIEKGHNAWSCDILDTEVPGNHIKGDVRNILNDGWDLMIAFPPCTYLSYAGIAHWNKPGRLEKRLEALAFFAELWKVDIEKICIENPKGCASPTIAKYSQEIQPYFFGDKHIKTTWLWLKNLPKLMHFAEDDFFNKKTHTEKPEPLLIHKRKPGKHYKGGELKRRYITDKTGSFSGHKRSRFWKGIANAMAEQWG
jgi:hypothetical protein